jgi:hypothetical protein
MFVTMDVNTLKQMYFELEREIRSIGLSVNLKNKKRLKYMTESTPEVRRRPQNLSVGETKV